MRNKILLVLGLALFSGIAMAQKAIIKGTILDEKSKAPVQFLNVLVEGTSLGTVTDQDGKFQLSLDAGTYNLVFSSIDYEAVTEKITVVAGETKEFTKSINEKPVELVTYVKSEGKFEKKLEELTVSMEVLKPNIVNNKNATNASQSLQQVPGVNIVDSEPQIRSGSGYSFGAGSRVMVLVDDVPMLTGDAGRPAWGFIPIENLEQIEVIKGASSVLYGSAALNGVINIRTAYPKDKPFTRITTFSGIYNLQDSVNWATDFPPFQTGISFLHSRKIKQNFDLVIGGNLFAEKGYIGPSNLYVPSAQTIDTVLNGENDYRARVNFNTRYRFKKKPGLSIGINGNFLYESSNGSFLYSDPGKNVYRAFAGAMTRTLSTLFNIDPYLAYIGKGGSTYNLRTRYFFVDYNNNNGQGNGSSQFFGEFQYQKRFLGEKSKNSFFLKNFNITAGTMMVYTVGRAQLFSGNPPNPPGAQDSVTVKGIYTTNFNFAAYTQIENRFWDRLTISLGARLEYFSTGKYDTYNLYESGNTNPKDYDTSVVSSGLQPVFRGGFNVKAASFTFIRGSVGQGYRFPTIAERFIKTTVGGVSIAPNPGLKPERSWSVELGIKQGFKIGKNFMGYADVAGYYQEYDNFIEFNFVNLASGPGFMSLNTGRARILGIDFSIMGGGKFGKNWTLNVLAGYNWSLPQSLTPNYDYGASIGAATLTYANSSTDTTNNILKYRFQHTLKFDAEVTWKFISFGASIRYNSFMQNIDLAFHYLNGPPLNVLPNIKGFRDGHNMGDWVLDMRLAVQVSKTSKLSFIVNNVANRIYQLRPGKMEAPRSFVVQYTYQF
jgi:outer membrane receptor protein involved in Fe transport